MSTQSGSCNHQTSLAALYEAKFKCNKYVLSLPASVATDIQQGFGILTSFVEELLIALNKIKCTNETNIYSSLSACLRVYFPDNTTAVTNDNAANNNSASTMNNNSISIMNNNNNSISVMNSNSQSYQLFLQQTFDLLSFCLTTIECINESLHKVLLQEVCFKHCYLFFHIAISLYGDQAGSDVIDAINSAAETFVRVRGVYRSLNTEVKDKVLSVAFLVIQVIFYGLVQTHNLTTPHVDLSSCRLTLKVNNIRNALSNINQTLASASKGYKSSNGPEFSGSSSGGGSTGKGSSFNGSNGFSAGFSSNGSGSMSRHSSIRG